MVKITINNPDNLKFYKKDGTINDEFWLKWLFIYYIEYVDWTEWEAKTGRKYTKQQQDSTTAWNDIFLPFFRHFGYDDFCLPVFDALIKQTQEMMMGFDANKHLDLIVEKDGEEYILHFPSGYDLL